MLTASTTSSTSKGAMRNSGGHTPGPSRPARDMPRRSGTFFRGQIAAACPAIAAPRSPRQVPLSVGICEQPHVMDRSVHIGEKLLHRLLVADDLSGPFGGQKHSIRCCAEWEVHHA